MAQLPQIGGGPAWLRGYQRPTGAAPSAHRPLGEAAATAAGEMLKKKKKGKRSKGSHNAKEMKQKQQRRAAGSGT